VAGRRAANVAQARRESDQYQDWLALELSKLGEEDALQAWDPPPPEKHTFGTDDMRATVKQIDNAVEQTLTMAARHLRNLPADDGSPRVPPS
jgi:hypothetical protein